MSFICTICYRSASAISSEHCGVPRLPLGDPNVVEMVRQHADKLLQRRKMREDGVIFAMALVLGFAVWIPFAAPALSPPEDFYGPPPFPIRTYLLLSVAIAGFVAALRWVQVRVFKGSARATLAARRLRISDELRIDAQLTENELADAHIAEFAGADPLLLPLPELLGWLKVSLDR